MKKLFSLALILFLYIGCAPKLSTTQPNSDLKELNALLSNGEYEKYIEFMPTDFWNAYEKNKFLAGIKRIGNQTGNISSNNLKIKNVSNTIKSNDKYFKVIAYSNDLEFDVSNISDKVIKSFNSKFGIENVKLDTINKLIQIKNNSQIISVYDDKLKEWKYIENNSIIITKVYGIETWKNLIKHIR